MKTSHILFMSLSILSLICCSVEGEGIKSTPFSNNIDNEIYKTSIGEAISLAKDVRQSLSKEVKTRVISPSDEISSVVVCRKNEIKNVTRNSVSCFALPDTIMYIINFANNSGYAIMAADKRFGGIFVYAEEGNLYSIEDTDNAGLKIFLSSIEEYCMEKLASNGGLADDSVGKIHRPDYPTYSIDSLISPLLTTKWGQGPPYNNYCPVINDTVCPTGCVATAVGQLVAYYSYPNSYNGHVYDWDWITLGPIPTFTEGINGVALLMQDIGRITETTYGTTESGTNPSRVIESFDSLGYHHRTGIDPYSFSICLSEISRGCPVLIKGNNGDFSSGHIWVLDGILILDYVEIQQTFYGPIPHHTYEQLVHCNWGQNGNGNGYYLSGVFDTAQKKADDDITRADFSQNLGIWYDIWPYNQ